MAKVNWHDTVEKDLGFGNAVRIVTTVGVRTEELAKATAPRDTGSLANAIEFWQISAGTGSLGRIGVLNSSLNRGNEWRYLGKKKPRRPTNADVLFMHHQGINLIVAKRAKKGQVPYLKFRGSAGHMIRTQYTVGYPKDQFLTKAFKRACPYPVVEFFP